MRVSDFVLLAKKIGVGMVITAIPLGIFAGGLWFSRKVLAEHEVQQSATASGVAHEN